MNLYTINDQVKNFLTAHADQETGELIMTDDLASQLEGLELNRAEKQKNIILYVKNAEGEADIIDSEIKRLGDLKRMNAKKQENLKLLLEYSMKQGGETALDFITCGAKFKKNPPSLVIDKDADVSPYMKIVTTESVDKMAIRKDLKEGKEVAGCKMVAGERLEIQ